MHLATYSIRRRGLIMLGNTRTFIARLLAAMLVTAGVSSEVIAQDSAWRVSKSSGEVWITTSGAQPVALTDDAGVNLNPGDTIRTGRNGRLLLMRGAETILVSANSVVGIPKQEIEGLSTIIEQAGSILLDVEKRNVQHFEVLTPYLAAVVKGTQFRVTVDNGGSQVDVLRGQVQVSDYKSGQYALVNPEQTAKVSVEGPSGLSLSGQGALSPIQMSVPRRPLVRPITIPDGGFSAPQQVQNPQQRSASASEGGAPWAPASSLQASKDYGPAADGWAMGGQELGWTAADPVSSDETDKDYGFFRSIVTWGKFAVGLVRHKTHDDDPLTSAIVIPAAIGFLVALGARVMQGRQRQKQRRK